MAGVIHNMFCARPYTGPVKIQRPVRQASYSLETQQLIGETFNQGQELLRLTGQSVIWHDVVREWAEEKTS